MRLAQHGTGANMAVANIAHVTVDSQQNVQTSPDDGLRNWTSEDAILYSEF